MLHRNSRRATAPFITVQCAAKPDDVLDAELFGRAITESDGSTSQTGAFQQADGGTLFLNGIGDLSPSMAARLIGTLQHRKIRPVGNRPGGPIDVRVLTASSRDLESALEAGTLSRDLED